MEDKLTDIMLYATNINVYKNGEKLNINMEELNTKLNSLFFKSYYMPGLSIFKPDAIEKQMQKGYYIEFEYNRIESFAGMPFKKLLVAIKPDYDGLNIIRCENDKYEGRGYYINLATYTNDFFNYLESIK